MADYAIRASGIGKQYRIGEARQSYQTLRDALSHGAMAPVRAVRRLLSRAEASPRQMIWALRDVSFDASQGEVIGFIGRNGAGKSTLLKVLSRITEPTIGSAEIRGKVGSLLEVGTGFHPELSGRENAYLSGAILGMNKASIDKKFDEIVAFAEVEQFVDTPVKHYSSGMYLRMAFAVAAHLDPEILLVDEVLAVGDAAFQKKCLTKMVEVAKAGQTVLFVSHNLDAVLTLCSRSIVLTKGQVDFDGTPQDAITHYHRTLCAVGGSLDESMIYQEGPDVRPQLPRVTGVEALRADGEPASLVTTWDDIVFRIHYVSDKTIPDGSIVIDIRDYKEQRLMVLDSGPKLGIMAGNHFVDCHVRKLPLPSGEYFLTIGITNPFVDWLWRGFSLGALRVNSRDIYQIGRPPTYTRMTIAAEYSYSPDHMPSNRTPAAGVGVDEYAHSQTNGRSSTRQLA